MVVSILFQQPQLFMKQLEIIVVLPLLFLTGFGQHGNTATVAATAATAATVATVATAAAI